MATPGFDFSSVNYPGASATGGSNQWMSGIPTMSMTMPGMVPPQNTSAGGGPNQFTGPSNAPGMTGIGKGMFALNPLDPALTSGFFNYLQGQLGKGVSPFDLSASLPSSGGVTQPGQLSAPLTGILQQLQKLFMPGGQIGDMASQGVSALPVWQQMKDAMQRQLGEGRANLREQYGVQGLSESSPFGGAASDYELQSNKELNSLLGQLQMQGIQDQLGAAGLETGAGQMFQNIDQSSIDRMLQEFIRTSPEYNPLLPFMMNASTTFPPVVNPRSGAGGLGGILGSLGGILGAIPGLKDMFHGSGGSSGGGGGGGFDWSSLIPLLTGGGA